MPKSYFKSADWDKDVPQQDSALTSYKVNKLAHKAQKRSVSNGWNIESVIENGETQLSVNKTKKQKKIDVNSKTSQVKKKTLEQKKEKTPKQKNNTRKLDSVKAHIEPAELALAQNKKNVINNEVSFKTDGTTVLPIEKKKFKAKNVHASNNVLIKDDKKSSAVTLNQRVSSKKSLKVKPVPINYVSAPKIEDKKQTSESPTNEKGQPSPKQEKLKAKRTKMTRKKNKLQQSPGNTEEQVQEPYTRLGNVIKRAETIEKASKITKIQDKKNKALEIQKKQPIQQVKLKKQAILKNILEATPDTEAVNIDVKLERVSFRSRHLQTSLRKRMMEKLKAAQFRFLNEKLYLSEGKDAKELFQTDPDSYSIYHEGFRQQMKKWPINPLDIIIKQISAMSKDTKVADLGCGDGVLAKSVPQKVRSFDLVSSDPSVEACDMAHTPLLAGEVNVVVFCLALMGTNMNDYLIEANRVLKIGGTMKIAEVESRFQDVEQFIQAVEKFGFSLKKKDLSHNIFYFMDFKKHREVGKRNKLPYLKLKPCLYKKR